MRQRRRNNIIIGILCCAVIFMSVGYAILSSVLTINSTANIKGDFDIHFLNDDQNKKGISLIDYPASQTAGSTVYNTTVTSKAVEMEADTEVDSQDPTQATFSAILQKPTDYAIFTVTVKNYGTIDGYLTFSFDDTNNNFSYYDDFYSVEFIKEGTPDIKADILQNQTFEDSVVLSSNQTREYKIKVTFKESATEFPDTTTNGEFECAINLTYSQNAPASNSGSQEQSYPNDAWRVNSSGTVISYDPADLVNGTLTIPETDVNGNNIVAVDSGSFKAEYNVIYYSLNNLPYAIITDQEHYENLADIMGNGFNATVYSSTDHQLPAENDWVVYLYINPTATLQTFNYATDFNMATVEITTLDLRSATHLTTIGAGAFTENSISEIKFNNAITTIDEGAFSNNHLTGALTIPSSVQIIGQSAFDVDSESEYKLTGLNLSNATNLTSIGSYAFEDQNISTLDLSGATHLTTIGEGAFDNNHISGTLTIPSSLQTIGFHAFYENGITSLNFANATSLTTIGDSAFRFNALSSLDLSGATALTTIEESAFYQNRIQTLTLPSSIESIVEDAFCMQIYDVNNPNTSLGNQLQTINVPLSKSVFESKVGSGNIWYYDGGSRPNFQLIFTDYTCDYEGVCELN